MLNWPKQVKSSNRKAALKLSTGTKSIPFQEIPIQINVTLKILIQRKRLMRTIHLKGAEILTFPAQAYSLQSD